MYCLRFLNRARPAQQARLVSNSVTLRDAKPANTTPNVQESTTATDPPNANILRRRWIVPSNRDKRVLVWMKYYKSIDEVPEKITHEQLDKAQNRFRIRLANWMMVATIFGTAYAVWLGKKKAERGETVEQMNIDWHKKINAEYQADIAKTATEKNE